MAEGTMTPAHFDESFRAALAADHPDGERREVLTALGLPPTILSAIALGVALKAAGGDVSAAKFIREVCQGDPSPARDTDLTPYTDGELRALLRTLTEETP